MGWSEGNPVALFRRPALDLLAFGALWWLLYRRRPGLLDNRHTGGAGCRLVGPVFGIR